MKQTCFLRQQESQLEQAKRRYDSSALSWVAGANSYRAAAWYGGTLRGEEAADQGKLCLGSCLLSGRAGARPWSQRLRHRTCLIRCIESHSKVGRPAQLPCVQGTETELTYGMASGRTKYRTCMVRRRPKGDLNAVCEALRPLWNQAHVEGHVH